MHLNLYSFQIGCEAVLWSRRVSRYRAVLRLRGGKKTEKKKKTFEAVLKGGLYGRRRRTGRKKSPATEAGAETTRRTNAAFEKRKVGVKKKTGN